MGIYHRMFHDREADGLQQRHGLCYIHTRTMTLERWMLLDIGNDIAGKSYYISM